jgi:lipoprotein-releasing system permease protein
MWFLALRQMLARKKQTLLIFLGISLGTTIYVVIAGMQLGMRNYISEQLLNNTAHVIIKGNEQKIQQEDLRDRFFEEAQFVHWIVPPAGKRGESRLENPQGWFSRLERDPRVLAYSPRLTINAIVARGPLRTSIGLTGIIPEKHTQVTSLADYTVAGNLSMLTGGGRKIILGKGVMEKLGASVGDTIRISSGFNEAWPYRIVGVVQLGNHNIDDTMGLAHLSDVQSLNHSPGRVSEISVALDDIKLSSSTASLWSLYSNDKVEGWEEANASFMQIINIQDITRYVITFAILLVAAFGVYNVLSIMISQKQKEIAILRSIGYGPEKILQLFMIQGFLLGFIGGLSGLVLGLGANLLIGNIDLGFKIGKGTHLPISYDVTIFVAAFVAAQAAAAVASIIPARHAAQLTPLDIIRANI